jgi:dTDP-glucose pyrophosphorylase/CBS domain-containing protein
VTPQSEIQALQITPDATIRRAMTVLDRGARGIVLLVDADECFVGTITDGDIRRAILDGVDLDHAVRVLVDRKRGTRYAQPAWADHNASRAELRRIMRRRRVRQLPLLDARGHVVDLVLTDDLVADGQVPLHAVIMAGGLGTRLRPLTDQTPKPMLPVAGRPLLERTIEQLRDTGIRRVSVTTCYMPEKITRHFGDGSRFGVELNYVAEDTPLGTAGALGLLPRTEQPMLVINGDVVTRVDFRAMLEFHREHHAAMTVGVRQFDLQVPFGVIDTEGPVVREIREKPSVGFLINAGLYLIEPRAHDLVLPDTAMDMPDLIRRLVETGQTVVSFPIHEYWMDIGKLSDYAQVQHDLEADHAA